MAMTGQDMVAVTSSGQSSSLLFDKKKDSEKQRKSSFPHVPACSRAFFAAASIHTEMFAFIFSLNWLAYNLKLMHKYINVILKKTLIE